MSWGVGNQSWHIPRSTKLYDRTGHEITLDGVERIAI